MKKYLTSNNLFARIKRNLGDIMDEIDFGETFDKLIKYSEIILGKYLKLAEIEKKEEVLDKKYMKEYNELELAIETEDELMKRAFKNKDFLDFLSSIYLDDQDFEIEYLENIFSNKKVTLRFIRKIYQYLYLNDSKYFYHFLDQLSYSLMIKRMVELSEEEDELTNFKDKLIDFKYLVTYLDPLLEDEFTSKVRIDFYYQKLDKLNKIENEKFGDERLIYYLNNFLRIKNDVLVFKGNFFFSYLAYLRIRASSSMSNFDGYSYILDKSSKNKNKDYASAYEMLINMYKYCMPRDEKILKRKEASLY